MTETAKYNMHKMSFKSILIASLAFVFSVSVASAQTAPTKYGHMNLGNLLESLPESQKANEVLNAFTKPIAARLDSLTKIFEATAAQLDKEFNVDGTLTRVEAQKRYEALQKDQAFLTQLQQSAEQEVAKKREELLQPILTKVEEAVKAVGKENGYLMIFDTSTGAMLFALETEDVTPLVKKKIGL
jgi:outer membrane protein